jgi:hypothetical protein
VHGRDLLAVAVDDVAGDGVLARRGCPRQADGAVVDLGGQIRRDGRRRGGGDVARVGRRAVDDAGAGDGLTWGGLVTAGDDPRDEDSRDEREHDGDHRATAERTARPPATPTRTGRQDLCLGLIMACGRFGHNCSDSGRATRHERGVDRSYTRSSVCPPVMIAGGAAGTSSGRPMLAQRVLTDQDVPVTICCQC